VAGKIDRYQNIRVMVEGDELIIRCNINESQVDVQPSASGKTFVLATSGGAAHVPGTNLKVNLTVYRK